jgi:pyridoxamine 5'-phosphate oxidase
MLPSERQLDAALERLREADVDPDPFRQFRCWLDQAITARLHEPFAMTAATATADGRPSARTVLLRGFDEQGFVFYTDYESRKGRELAANPRVALLFHWAELERQVRIEGTVERTTAQESDRYFASRPWESRLSASASKQSEVVANRELLERRVAELRSLYADGNVPRPPNWGGFRVIPCSFEFWQGGPNRLHDRLRYYPLAEGGWGLERLSP